MRECHGIGEFIIARGRFKSSLILRERLQITRHSLDFLSIKGVRNLFHWSSWTAFRIPEDVQLFHRVVHMLICQSRKTRHAFAAGAMAAQARRNLFSWNS